MNRLPRTLPIMISIPILLALAASVLPASQDGGSSAATSSSTASSAQTVQLVVSQSDALPSDDERGYIGIYMDVTDGGIIVNGVMPGGPADKAGLAKGDRIVMIGEFDFRKGASMDDLANLKAGSEVVVSGARKNQRFNHTVTLSTLGQIEGTEEAAPTETPKVARRRSVRAVPMIIQADPSKPWIVGDTPEQVAAKHAQAEAVLRELEAMDKAEDVLLEFHSVRDEADAPHEEGESERRQGTRIRRLVRLDGDDAQSGNLWIKGKDEGHHEIQIEATVESNGDVNISDLPDGVHTEVWIQFPGDSEPQRVSGLDPSDLEGMVHGAHVDLERSGLDADAVEQLIKRITSESLGGGEHGLPKDFALNIGELLGDLEGEVEIHVNVETDLDGGHGEDHPRSASRSRQILHREHGDEDGPHLRVRRLMSEDHESGHVVELLDSDEGECCDEGECEDCCEEGSSDRRGQIFEWKGMEHGEPGSMVGHGPGGNVFFFGGPEGPSINVVRGRSMMVPNAHGGENPHAAHGENPHAAHGENPHADHGFNGGPFGGAWQGREQSRGRGGPTFEMRGTRGSQPQRFRGNGPNQADELRREVEDLRREVEELRGALGRMRQVIGQRIQQSDSDRRTDQPRGNDRRGRADRGERGQDRDRGDDRDRGERRRQRTEKRDR